MAQDKPLEGKDAYRYARRKLGFFTYWICRIKDGVTNLIRRTK